MLWGFYFLIKIALWPIEMLEPWPAAPPPAGIQTAPDAPHQINLDEPFFLETVDGVEVWALAEYDIQARILSRRRYYWDWGLPWSWAWTDISPIDLTVGWGNLSDTAIASQTEFWNFYRFGWLEFSNDLFASSQSFSHDIRSKLANMHMIPATYEVRAQLLDLRDNQTVRMKGFLVALGEDGELRAFSSMSRYDDFGPGDCEIMYVTAIEVIPNPEHTG